MSAAKLPPIHPDLRKLLALSLMARRSRLRQPPVPYERAVQGLKERYGPLTEIPPQEQIDP